MIAFGAQTILGFRHGMRHVQRHTFPHQRFGPDVVAGVLEGRGEIHDHDGAIQRRIAALVGQSECALGVRQRGQCIAAVVEADGQIVFEIGQARAAVADRFLVHGDGIAQHGLCIDVATKLIQHRSALAQGRDQVRMAALHTRLDAAQVIAGIGVGGFDRTVAERDVGQCG